MRTADIILNKGDRLPVIRRTVKVDGAAVNLSTGSPTVVFKAQPVAGGATVISAAGTIYDAPNGGIEYDWTSGDTTLAAGFYAAWFEVTISGSVLTVPNDGFLLLQVVADGSAEWSYSGDPSARPLDAVRFLVGDTNPDDRQVRDAEITWALSENGANTRLAAADVAETISAKFTSKATTSRTVGDLSISTQYADRAAEYRSLADRLRAQAADKGAPIATAGSTGSDRQFYIGQMDNPTVDLPNYLRGGATSS